MTITIKHKRKKETSIDISKFSAQVVDNSHDIVYRKENRGANADIEIHHRI